MERHATPGIFLGYHLLAGGRWHGDYKVAAKADFDRLVGGDGKLKFRVHRVPEVGRDTSDDFVHPMKEFS